ncbi:MAG: flagellin FliC [Chitinivibrionia bacterium]|nr:flagellin FliC [Chitinivibrionia bacterium]
MPKINTNTQAMLSAGAIKRTQRSLTISLERLSTGNSINRSSDNAAGLSVSEQLRMQANGLAQGNRNINDGLSLLNIAEGGIVEIQNMLHRLRELAVQASTATMHDDQREFIQLEVNQLVNEIDRIAASTRFNGRSMLNGTPGVQGTYDFNPWEHPDGGIIHIGANHTTEHDTSDVLNVRFTAANSEALGLRDPNARDELFPNPNFDPAAIPPDPDAVEFFEVISFLSSAEAQAAISILDTALDSVSRLRSNIGSYSNRLEHALASQENVLRNVESAESQIRHVDFAKETVQFTRLQILNQASTSMLAQANSLPNTILQLLN